MKRRIVLWSCLSIAALPVMIGGGWILSLPPSRATKAAPPVTQDETDAMLTAVDSNPRRPGIPA
jgi:hypothetical protein